MIDFLIQKAESKHPHEEQRTLIGKLAGELGLIFNIFLFLAKFLVGWLTGSVSITADAMNSLSDMVSSLFTVVGFQAAAKPADKEHPYGHKRFEYISGLAVALLVTLVGASFLRSSLEKIFAPKAIRLSFNMFLILLFSILLKLGQAKMYRDLAKRIDSSTLTASSKDSSNDVFMTALVVISAGIEYSTGFRIDGYIGFLLALYILISGINMVKDFIDELLGSRPTEKEVQKMEALLDSYTTILGYHDLLVHDYGPDKKFASVHIEVDANWSLMQAHEVIDAIEKDFYHHLQVELVCHLDPVTIHDAHYLQLSLEFHDLVKAIDPQLKIHDFRIQNEKTLQFDLVVPEKFVLPDATIKQQIENFAKEKGEDYELEITFDHHYLL